MLIAGIMAAPNHAPGAVLDSSNSGKTHALVDVLQIVLVQLVTTASIKHSQQAALARLASRPACLRYRGHRPKVFRQEQLLHPGKAP